MEEALVGAVVGATIQVVLQNLLSISLDEIKRVYGLKKDLSKLKESLELIQDFLYDAEAKQVNDRAVKRWLGRLEDVAFKADAVLDEFNYDLLRKKVKKQNGETNMVTTCFPPVSCKLLFTMKMASKIKDVNDELERINKDANNFGLQAAAHSSNINVGINTVHYPDYPQTNSFSAEPNIIGRDDEVLKIVDLLVTAPQDQTISVIPIVGMGGLGKTTLARKVYHHQRVEAHFEKQLWVCVSVSLNALALFKLILETLTGASVHGMQTEEAVLDNIKKSLASKKYLLVLDDFWNENANEWDAFRSSLSGISSVSGNCILVTTRSGIVASNVQTLSTPLLRNLSKDECWSIIKSKAFQGVVPAAFEEVGTRIAQTCGGLPLAAKVVGGLLRGKSKHDWQSILTNQLLKFGPGDTVTKILKLSYDRLPTYVHKKCFAYCSIFPQDFEINREKLIELWMAEGYLQGDRGNDMETMGDAIFNHFLENSLFQDEKTDEFGNISHCKMHDLVQDLACSIAKGTHRVRYLMVKDEPDAISQDQLNYLRTLFVSGKTLPHLFPGFTCLYVLNLRGMEMEELPTVIGNLIHLRFLNISETGIKCLPDSIGKLYNLQSLWISEGQWEVVKLKILPNSIIDMISLRHLHIPTSVELPPGIGKLANLHTLPCYKVGHEKGRSIKELGKLMNLQGEVEIQNLERVKDKEEADQAWLSRKSKILKLVFKWNASQDERNDENVLDGLQPHPSLKSLEIIGYSGRSFPRWAMNMEVDNHIQGSWKLLHNLMDIKLVNCKQCEEVPMLGHLRSLKFLRLDGLSNVQTIGHSFYGIRNGNTSSPIGDAKFGEPIIAFPALERLYLSNMTKLSEWTEVEAGITTVFPCLKYLEIWRCPKLKTVLSHFPRLEKLYITSCPELESIPSVKGLTSLRELYISSCEKLRELPPDLNTLTSLRELYISSCEKLRELPPDLNTLQSLEGLWITDCPGVKSIPYGRVGGGGGDGDYSQQQQALTSSLRELCIINCRGLIELPVELFESCSSSLEYLTLVKIPKLMKFPSMGEISSLNLKRLRIGGFSDSISLDSFNQHLNQILPNLTSLYDLRLYGKEDWDSLPHQIKHLTSLERLRLYDFGRIESLPEWIRNLSSLRHLEIRNCKGLEHLQSKEASSDWPKISHIKYVFIDGVKL